MFLISVCKGTDFRNIHQISCKYQKKYLILQSGEKIFPSRVFKSPNHRISF